MEVIKRYPQIDDLISSLTRIANNLDKITLQQCPDQNRDDEIQDLKLENDRLNKREDIMLDFISSISCSRKVCSQCKLNRPDKFDELGAKCAYLQGSDGLEYIRTEAYKLIKKVEEL